jgi:hypothetical protein
MKPLLRKVIADSALPKHDSHRSAGRDAQCELHVAAICEKAGMAPELAEPDICCSVDGIRYGIAVKRVKSESQIEKHIRKASRQIELAELPGHIAMDVSMAFNPQNQRVVGVSDAELARAHQLATRRFGDAWFGRMKQWVRGRDVRSVILLDHFVRQHPVEGWGLNSFTRFIPLSPDNQRRRREFDAFQRRFIKGLATPVT